VVWAVLVAAGRGERLGGDRPKAFARLGSGTVLAESLGRIDASAAIDSIVVVAPPGWEEPAILAAEEIGAEKVVACITGGTRSRAESVRIGVAEVPETAKVILVHDAARPLINDEVIGRVLAALDKGADGAVPALPLADTIKRAPQRVVVETLDRADLWAVQTPQAFVATALRRALEATDDDLTDCASYVERNGGRVVVVDGDVRLAKVTTLDDLASIEGILAAERRPSTTPRP
jgi:2-C-methyl-D-erythritol 4-phosphate cytidylyltransferase